MNLLLWWIAGAVFTLSVIWIWFFLVRPKIDRRLYQWEGVNTYRYERKLQAELAIWFSILAVVVWPVVWCTALVSAIISGVNSAVEWLSDRISQYEAPVE